MYYKGVNPSVQIFWSSWKTGSLQLQLSLLTGLEILSQVALQGFNKDVMGKDLRETYRLVEF